MLGHKAAYQLIIAFNIFHQFPGPLVAFSKCGCYGGVAEDAFAEKLVVLVQLCLIFFHDLRIFRDDQGMLNSSQVVRLAGTDTGDAV